MNNSTINETDIAIIGMAGRFPGAKNVYEFWNNLKNSVESIRFYTDQELLDNGIDKEHLLHPDYVKAEMFMEDVEMFDAGFFGFNPKDAAIMDPQHRHFLEICWEALEDSGYVPDEYKGTIGIFGGCGMNSYFIFNLLANPELVKSTGLFLLRHTGNDKDFLTTRVSYTLNLKGPSVNVQTACSTSLVAIHYAAQSILNGECNIALAGGITIDLPLRRGYLYEEGEVLSPDGHCRAFDNDSKGTIFGSGGGIVVLKRLEDAIKDRDNIHAVIKGSAINNDGSMKVGYLAPSVDGQAEAMRQAIEVAGISADSISYIEAHGTGTPLGDPIEITALTKAFRKDTSNNAFCRIGSAKTNIGHLDTGAGVAGVIKTVMSLKNELIPESLHLKQPNKNIDWESTPFVINKIATKWEKGSFPRRAGINSIGVGGTNAHIILEEAPTLTSEPGKRDYQTLFISARSENALEKAEENILTFIKDNKPNLADVAYTLQVGRKSFKNRKAIIINNLDLCEASNTLISKKNILNPIESENEKNVIFMFPGAGLQYPNMGSEFYEKESIFRNYLDLIFDIIYHQNNQDLKSLVYPPEHEKEYACRELQNPTNSLLANFAIEVAMAKMIIEYGIKPSAFIGHSLGEYAAAHVSGIISIEDSIKLIIARGKVLESLPEGGMISVNLPLVELTDYLSEDLSLAAENGNNLNLISGPKDAVLSLEEALRQKNIDFSVIKVNTASHSSMMDPYLSGFLSEINKIKFNPPQIPILSCNTADWLNEKDLNPEFWVNHLRNPVRFSKTIRKLLSSNSYFFLEVGPGSTLCSLLNDQGYGVIHNSSSTFKHPKDIGSDYEYFLRGISKVWMHGGKINYKKFWKGENRRRISLPTYPFEHKPYWIKPGNLISVNQKEIDPLKKIENLDKWFYTRSWIKLADLNKENIENKNLNYLLISLDNNYADLFKNILGNSSCKIENISSPKQLKGNELLDYYKNEYEELFKDISQVNRMYFFLSTDSILDYNEYLNKYLNILSLLQIISDKTTHPDFSLNILTKNGFKFKNNGVIDPVVHSLFNALKVAQNEFPEISLKLIDYTEFNPEQILKTSELEKNGKVLLLRNNVIYKEEYSNVKLDGSTGITLKQNGIYVLTGGLGGMATTLAKYLIKEFNANIILVGRSSELTISSQNKLNKLNKIGNVEYLKADVNEYDEIKNVLEFVKQKHGTINGIFHTAGTINDKVIQLKDYESSNIVLKPKIGGIINLSKIADVIEPEFIILFSSTSSVLGAIGQFDYAASNSFLDAFSERYSSSKTKYLTIGWGQWQKLGMAARMANNYLDYDEFEECNSYPLVNYIIHDTDDIKEYLSIIPATHWLFQEHKTKDDVNLMPGTGLIELIHGIIRLNFPQKEIEILDLLFMSPIISENALDVRIKTKITKINSGYEFTITSENNNIFEENVRGEFRIVDAINENKIHIDEVKKLFINRKEVINKDPQHPKMNFGKRWKVIDELFYNKNEVLIRLSIPDEYLDDLKLLKLHPSLFDIATGMGQFLSGIDLQTNLFVPFNYKKILIHKELPSEFYSRINYYSDDKENTMKFDVYMFDLDGNILIEVREFIMKKFSGTLINEKSKNLKANVILDYQKEGILPEEGIEIIKKLFLYNLPSSIYVTSQDLNSLLKMMVKKEQIKRDSIKNELSLDLLTDLEKDIISVWKEVLGTDNVGLNDDFIELGGHSLLLTRAIIRLKKKYNVEISIENIFRTPTVASFLEEINKKSNKSEASVIKAVSRDSYKVKL